ncbi:MAG: hypothetical protein WBA43_22515 [Elainellaceae cyanobacterium]
MSRAIDIREWESSILEMLDTYAQEYDFPMFNNIYYDYADARLTLLRSSSAWVFVFEEIQYSHKQRSFVNSISAYGNKIENPGLQETVVIFTTSSGNPRWEEEDFLQLDKFDFQVCFGKDLRKFCLSPEDYDKSGIPENTKMGLPAQLLRIISYAEKDRLFLDNNEILGKFNKGQNNLNIFMQVNDWFHPDIADDQLPSDSICFQNLALAISRCDPSLYLCPDETLNVHWSNWTELA